MTDTNDCNSASFKEAVCIDAGRVYDSCCDRDCLEDLRCYFSPQAQDYVDKAVSVRLKSAEVLNVLIDVEPVSFNKGFFSCDLSFFFLLTFDLYLSPNSCAVPVKGVAFFNKKVILFGSDGNVKVFSGRSSDDANSCERSARLTSNMPKCVVQCVDPIPLSAHIGQVCDCYESLRHIPQCVCDCIGGNPVVDRNGSSSTIYATIGLFTIVQLIRNVQMLIPVYDFCIPEKQCDSTTDQPCDVFRRIKFPTDDFFPPRACDFPNDVCGCGCTVTDDE